MTITLAHVKHRVARPFPPDPRLVETRCGLRAGTWGGARDLAVHHPATSRCDKCYPVAS